MKIEGFRGIRCQYGLNQRESFPVYFASVLFLGKMGRGYARLPFEDNRGCPWTNSQLPKNTDFEEDDMKEIPVRL